MDKVKEAKWHGIIAVGLMACLGVVVAPQSQWVFILVGAFCMMGVWSMGGTE